MFCCMITLPIINCLLKAAVFQLALRMTFPAVTANTSAVSILPQLIDVLGRKLDKIPAELDSPAFFGGGISSQQCMLNVLASQKVNVHIWNCRTVSHPSRPLKPKGFLEAIMKPVHDHHFPLHFACYCPSDLQF